MYRDDLGILTFVIKGFGITNTSAQNFEFPLLKLYRSVCGNGKFFKQI